MPQTPPGLSSGMFSSAGKRGNGGETNPLGGKQTLQEEAGVGEGFVLLFPDTVELQKSRRVDVVEHGDDLLPAVTLPKKGRRRDSGAGGGTPLTGNDPRTLVETPKPAEFHPAQLRSRRPLRISPGETFLPQGLDDDAGDVHRHDAEGEILQENAALWQPGRHLPPRYAASAGARSTQQDNNPTDSGLVGCCRSSRAYIQA